MTQEEKGKRYTGTLMRAHDKGFGFIQPDQAGLDPGGKGIFVHVQDFRPKLGGKFVDLAAGTRLEFGVAETPKGLRAVEVKVIGAEEKEKAAGVEGWAPPAKAPRKRKGNYR